MIISYEHICTLRNKVASLKNCRNSFICEREAFFPLIFRLLPLNLQTVVFPIFTAPSLQNRLKETSLVMGPLSLVGNID